MMTLHHAKPKCTTFFSLFLLFSGMSGLSSKDVTLVVPKVILEGENLVMDCRFPSSESAMVNSVKW